MQGEEIADKLCWLGIKIKLVGIRFGDYPKTNISSKVD
jgi:hypothetical protein